MGVEELVESHMGELKQVSLKVFGMIPYAGAFLSIFVTVMWPKDNKDPWGDVKTQVGQLVTEQIDKDRAQKLQDEMEALSESVKTYRDTTGASQKSQWFTTILNNLERMHVFFIKEADRAPWNIVPLYAIYGTAALSIYREQCMFYKQIYGMDDPDAASHLKTLQTKKTELINALAKLKQGCIDHRKTFIKWGDGGHHQRVIDEKTKGYEWPYDKLYKQDVADAAVAQRKQWCENSYATSLDRLLDVYKTWQFMDMVGSDRPTYLPTAQMTCRTGPYGSSKPNQTKFDDEAFWRQHGDITKIAIHEADKVDGIEVWYGGVSSGLRGKAGGTDYTMELNIDKGERCVSTSGLATIGGGTVDNIMFFREAPARPKGNWGVGNLQKLKQAGDKTDEDINRRYLDQNRWQGAENNVPVQPKESIEFGGMSTSFFNHNNGGQYADSPFAFNDSAPLDQNYHWYDGEFSFGDNVGGLVFEDGKTKPAPSVLNKENNPTEWVVTESIDDKGVLHTEWRLKKNRPTRRLAYIYGEYSKDWTLEMIGFGWAFEEIHRS